MNLKNEDAIKNFNEENNENNLPKELNFLNNRQVFENKTQKQFKNIFRGNDFFENNYYRKRVMYLTICCILIDILHLQILW